MFAQSTLQRWMFAPFYLQPISSTSSSHMWLINSRCTSAMSRLNTHSFLDISQQPISLFSNHTAVLQ